jgi:hypothetical protein
MRWNDIHCTTLNEASVIADSPVSHKSVAPSPLRSKRTREGPATQEYGQFTHRVRLTQQSFGQGPWLRCSLADDHTVSRTQVRPQVEFLKSDALHLELRLIGLHMDYRSVINTL